MAEAGTIDGWVVLRAPPTKDDKGHPIPKAQLPPTEVVYKGVQGSLSPGGVRIIWPEQPDLDGLLFMPDKAAPIVDFYLGHRTDWPFPWLKIVPVAQRKPAGGVKHDVKQETVATPAVAPPQPVQAEVPEQKPVTTPSLLEPVTQAPRTKNKGGGRDKKLERQAGNLKYEDGKLVF